MDTPLRDRTLARVLRAKAEANGERPFITFEGRTTSYAQAYELSRKIAGGLAAAGIGPRQHVAIMMDNRAEVVWLNFALAMIGAVAVPINTATRGDLLAYYVRQSDAVAIVLDTAHVERFAAVRGMCPALELAVEFPDGPSELQAGKAMPGTRVLDWAGIAETAPPLEDIAAAAYDDVLHILYSSGTTGASKGSMVSNVTATSVAARFAQAHGLNRDDVLYTCLPMFHGNAWNCTILPALMADASVALSKRFSASRFWREINETGATHTSLLSAMINILWLLAPTPQERTHTLRICLVVPTPEFAAEFEQRYGVTIASIYSLSDFGLATVLAPHDPRDKLRSAGRPLPEVSVAILDEDDSPLPAGQVGEICLRNKEPWFCRAGYYKMGDVFAKALRNLWFHTGDRGWMDEDGYLYFAGRSKELIRRRGENISAIQVEQVLMRHPAVADAAVFAVRAEFLEDEVMACIVCKDGQSLEAADLVEFCAPQMAYFMVPRFIEFVPQLPVTPTNKVEKYKLREAMEPRLADVWDREKSGIVLEK
jgi:crotonobetaine/carnitine-CoA ligase